MSFEAGYKFERYEQYYGDAQQVKKIMDECQVCGSQLVHTHLSDYKHLMIQETARCPECGGGQRKLIHVLN